MKEIVEEFKDFIGWILAGCPKPVKIPVKPKDGENEKRRKR